jgi:hypothetical protein
MSDLPVYCHEDHIKRLTAERDALVADLAEARASHAATQKREADANQSAFTSLRRAQAAEAERDALAEKLAMAVECIKHWQSAGCPYCQGDCASANPPIAWCIMAETRATLAALEDKT